MGFLFIRHLLSEIRQGLGGNNLGLGGKMRFTKSHEVRTGSRSLVVSSLLPPVLN